jgi:tRNA A37 threonylcarbamoyltransferase TsaD
VSAGRKRPTGPPPSAGVLARYAQAYARELGVAEGRVRAWVAYMIMAGVLDRATTADSARFIVKGGVALELRLRDRATKEATSSSGTRLRTSPAASRRR